jgi:hypothetical protein
MMTEISYSGYRFPPEIIQQAIWLYLRFTLSFRDVEDLLAERGIVVSYVGDHDAPFRQQVFDVTQAQGKPEIKPDRLLDDLWRKSIAAIADFLHSFGYRTASGTASPKWRDKALSFHAAAYNTFNIQRHLISARTHRAFGASAMNMWREAVAVA